MKYLFLLTSLFTSALFGADVTGSWIGTFTPSDGQTGSALLVLKQDGAKLTGTAGPNSGEQMEISNGKVEGSNITFEIAREDGSKMTFVLKLEGEAITGEIARIRDGDKKTAKLEVKREK